MAALIVLTLALFAAVAMVLVAGVLLMLVVAVAFVPWVGAAAVVIRGTGTALGAEVVRLNLQASPLPPTHLVLRSFEVRGWSFEHKIGRICRYILQI